MRAADKDEMNKTLIHCLMRGQVVAVRDRIIDPCVLGHLSSDLNQRCGLAQLREKGNGGLESTARAG
jgi:hypothetical protein